ncbi:Uncharacterised protein [Legionella sainthelensi]|nr:Uncharacterised protein [Legionella sainthelensi]
MRVQPTSEISFAPWQSSSLRLVIPLKDKKKPLYRPQFFASHQENVIAGKLNETYKLLKITEDAENQLSKSMLNN